jgi:hypothetical protein
MSKDSSGNKPVGYRNPPTHTRFKSGVSGNPKGRPKTVPTFAEDIQDELNRPHRLNANETVTSQRAIIMALVAKAIEGDTRAVGTLMHFFPKHVEQEKEPRQRDLSPGQHALLQELVAEEIASKKEKELVDDEKVEKERQQDN